MTFLPTQLAPSSAWRVYDYRWVKEQSPPAAGGLAQLELPQVAQGELWLIERITVHCTSAATTQARLYLDNVDTLSLVDGTRSGNFDVADQGSPIQVPGGSVLICQWTGADDDARGILRAQVVILKQVQRR